MSSIKYIIAVASGKGGVGKSTTAVNLALALLAEYTKASVGLLDADIYGPSQPLMLGVDARAQVRDGKQFMPIKRHGLQTMSIGYLIDSKTPMIWRGPMVSKALQQLMGDTCWEPLDYLVIDLPPGTGDIQLTLVQKIKVTGAIVVTTPQDIALLDAHKGLSMFKKVNTPVLGIVENMSHYVCRQCGHRDPIFGSGGGQRMSDETGVPLLASLPLDSSIHEQTDSGVPPVVAQPDGLIAAAYRTLARRVVERIETL